jgi:hypothetical protein
MIKVQILIQCHHCNGKGYIPIEKAKDYRGDAYTRHIPCPVCDGSGKQTGWVDIDELAALLLYIQPCLDYSALQAVVSHKK